VLLAAEALDLVANPVKLHNGTLRSDVMGFPLFDDRAFEQEVPVGTQNIPPS
jgi:hypothetical protein